MSPGSVRGSLRVDSGLRLPATIPDAPVWRLTLREYHHLIQSGFFDEDEPLELLDGFLIQQYPRGPLHDCVLNMLGDWFCHADPKDCRTRIRSGVTLDDSEPEPDVAVARGTSRAFMKHHPFAHEVALIAEVAGDSLNHDRGWKANIYARAKIPVYWIVNLVDRQIEVHTEPGKNVKGEPAYLKKKVYRPGDLVPVVLFGQEVGKLAVSELLPG